MRLFDLANRSSLTSQQRLQEESYFSAYACVFYRILRRLPEETEAQKKVKKPFRCAASWDTSQAAPPSLWIQPLEACFWARFISRRQGDTALDQSWRCATIPKCSGTPLKLACRNDLKFLTVLTTLPALTPYPWLKMSFVCSLACFLNAGAPRPPPSWAPHLPNPFSACQSP
ncbi:uncharacterized protein RBU33_010716 [Hipposideros larvatus]